ncbi:MAG: hypothetical protein MUF48_18765 [Pirellulaceae bacterium]|jgi:hypothetical protein|nr:hypothetical protein [Pirellulaceae bacterium]
MPTYSQATRVRAADDRLACAVAAHATLRVPLEALGTLRDNPGLDSSPPLPPRFLRHADEQTVVGLAAVLRAMAAPHMARVDFADWGVLAAPRLLGRLSSAATLNKFVEVGVPAISPHVIPQHSLHAVSSAVSVALGLHGPNFGIGGGPESTAEGLLAALTFLRATQVPGMWLVLTEWDREPTPDGQGGSVTPAVCCASALALVPDKGGPTQLRIRATRVNRPAQGLVAWLADQESDGSSGRWTLPLSWGGHIEFAAGAPMQQRKAA